MELTNFDDEKLVINSDKEEINQNKNIIAVKSPIISKKSIKLKDIPYIIYPVLFTILILIITIIIYLVFIFKYKVTYIYEENAYTASKYSSHKYSSIQFENGLKVVLVQVDSDDYAGGSISFDYGYLDNKYAPGHINYALVSLISDNVNNSEPYINYLGEFNHEIGKYYSSFYFQILGGGFQNYLKNFSTLTYFAENETRFKQIKDKYVNYVNNFEEKRNHLLDYLVYGYYNFSKNRDIKPQGDKETKDFLRKNYTIIEDIMKRILSDPSKIKIVLYSHYKQSLMKKFFLKAFSNITNRPKKNNNNQILPNAYNISGFTTNKIIYYQLTDPDTNYIEINYFLTNNATHEQLIKDSQYFNYIIYILNQTDENSLYYKLNHNDTHEVHIKSLSSYYEVVLRSKIKFSIMIQLNHYSYNNTDEIISKVYNYINNIILYINSYNSSTFNDIRLEELEKISEQNFTFTEDAHESIFYKILSNNLFYKDDKDYLLKKMWFSKDDFIKNFDLVKFYFNQLTLNNSVIFFGFNNETIYKYNIKELDLKYFYPTINTRLFGLKHSYHKLDEHIKPYYDNNYSKLLNPKKNEYISRYDSNSELEYNESDYNNYFNVSHEEINSKSDNIVKVYWKKDTSFKIPKMHSTIYFFHPFLRPNIHDIKNESLIKQNDRLYFEYNLFFGYLKRSIMEQLSDALRAGNYFFINYNENFFYMDLFFYSDIAEKAMKIINNITSDQDKFITELEKNFFVYKDIVLEDYLSAYQNDLDRMKFAFYQELTRDVNDVLPPTYNHYTFPRDKFIYITYDDLEKDELKGDINMIKYIFIFGYYNKSNAKNIYQIFKKNNTLFDPFILANYSDTRINVQNFVNWSLDKPIVNEFKNTSCISDKRRVNRFMIFTENSLKYVCLCDMLKDILMKDQNFTKIIYRFSCISQKNIVLSFIFHRDSLMENAPFINNTFKLLIDNENMTKPVDIIGGRFYYILKGYKTKTGIKHNNMYDSASLLTYNILYKINKESNDGLNFDIKEYKDYIEEIRKFIKLDIKYIDVFPLKKNNSSYDNFSSAIFDANIHNNFLF